MPETGLAAERAKKIQDLLKQRGLVTVDDLCTRLNASAATIRRDLSDLDERGILRRVHGGAVSVGARLEEPLFDDKTDIAAKEKQRIAETALKQIKPNQSIFLDGGSTVLALARLVADRHNLTVVTNSLRVAATLSGASPNMILVGGEFRGRSQTFVGSLTSPLIEQLRFDTAFVGTIGLSPTKGMTTTDPREAFTKELIIEHAGHVILLADSSKIGKESFVRFGNLESIDTLITDKGISKKDEQQFKKHRIRIMKA